MPLEVGSSIAHYQVTALIGEGGMGQVYQATDTKLNRQVALKIMPEAFASDPDRLARFQREAQVLASLNHPGIAQIYGLEEQDGTKALVLGLVEGPTLADRIAQGPIPVDEALPIAKQIAEALEAAHEQGIIHRDLKPANIKLRPDGAVKVLDFGLAKALDTAPEGDPNQSPTLTAAATQMGVIMGTAAYMSPEQARGKPVDKRSDIWSFGAVLYETLSGRPPFEGRDVSEVLGAVLRLDPDWGALPGDTSPTISSLLQWCLEKDPKKRIHDVADVRLAMGGALEPVASAAQQPQLSLWQRPVVVLFIATLSALFAGLAVRTASSPDQTTTDVTRFTIVEPDLAFDGSRKAVAISRDGSTIAYRLRTPGLPDRLFLRHIARLELEPVDERSRNGPFFSPDGQWIGFSGAGGGGRVLYKALTSGGPAIAMAEVPGFLHGASWGSDDQVIIGSDAGLFRVSGSGGPVEALTTLDPSKGESVHGWPAIIPGTQWVLFVVATDGAPVSTGRIAAFDLETKTTTDLGLAGLGPRYVPTGHLLYVTKEGTLHAAPLDLDQMVVTGGGVPLVEDVQVRATGATNFGVSDGGRLVYGVEPEARRVLVWVDRDGTEEVIPAPPRAYNGGSISPDGTRIAVEIRDRAWDVYLWNIAGESLTRLTVDPAEDQFPSWTPDGQRVLFTSRRDRANSLYWKRADGVGPEEWLATSNRVTTSIAPDGQHVLFNGNTVRGDEDDLQMLSLEGEHATEVLLGGQFDQLNGVFSPDGRWLAYNENSSGRPEVYVRPFPNVGDRRWQVSSAGGQQPVWAPDGRELFYIEGERLMAVPIEADGDFAFGDARVVVEGTYRFGGYATDYDVAADGRLLLVRDDDERAEPAHLVVVDNWFQELVERVPIP